MRFPKAMLGALALALAAGSIAVAQQGDKMVTAEAFRIVTPVGRQHHVHPGQPRDL